ncbi:IclR family transcriptional regulator C-terminal domain-containing protein [uncultured Streptomyces sp.]|uniref:IclR family transcriptional regulator domain-containing protein n=1 Tax=uncultured Streptomyces sp. TaxID=174707 RepID=UPI0026092848|nr:IclR family transcriptional regulator C-terminal domain-containing protein [uncultured Streptomyces sp.]
MVDRPADRPHLARLRSELGLVRRNGFAVKQERSERGPVAVGVPVRDRDGAAVAGLSVSMPSVRYDPQGGRGSKTDTGRRWRTKCTEHPRIGGRDLMALARAAGAGGMPPRRRGGRPPTARGPSRCRSARHRHAGAERHGEPLP